VLDLVKLTAQVSALSQHLQEEAGKNQRRLLHALSVYQEWQADPQRWMQRYEVWGSHLGFACGQPMEPGVAVDVDPILGSHTVVATDGSQIMPSHHEIAYCSLINVGRVGIPYGLKQRPLLDSVPVLYYRSADLGRRGIRSEELVSLRRTQAEMEELVQLAARFSRQDPNHLAQDSAPVPLLALTDGSLIHWSLDPLPTDEQRHWLEPILQSYQQLRQLRIPVMGYISAPRSREGINFLRLGLCPFEGSDCGRHCPDGIPPCDQFAPLTDRGLWAALLQPGQRSPLYRSGAGLLQHYGDHHIYACYLHVGDEVARVEMPAWVAQDPQLLAQGLGILLVQVQKGYGYPVALAEAHHLAVVRGGDRSRFFALVEQELQRAGLKQIAISRKEARKRQGIA
jgi:hypothetical protein